MPVDKPVVVYSCASKAKFGKIAFMLGFVNAYVLHLINTLTTPRTATKSAVIGETEPTKSENATEMTPTNTSDNQFQDKQNKLTSIYESKNMSWLKNAINIFKGQQKYHYYCLGGSAIVWFIFMSIARRTAYRITILPNKQLRFESFPPLGVGRPPYVELPLKDVSCVEGRKSQTNYAILKFNGRAFYHLIDKKDGHFLEPKLYDKYLGYQKAWLKKYSKSADY